MSESQGTQLAQAFFSALVDHALRLAAGFIPGGTAIYDLVKDVFDQVEKQQYVTRDELMRVLSGLSAESRVTLRENALTRTRQLTPARQNEVRRVVLEGEQLLFMQLLREAEHRDRVRAQDEIDENITRLRAALAAKLRSSKYKAALKIANELARLTPNDTDLLRTQQELERKLNVTLLNTVLGALLGGSLAAFLGAGYWALSDWSDHGPCLLWSYSEPRYCLTPSNISNIQWTDYLPRMIVIAGLGGILCMLVALAFELPKRVRRRRVFNEERRTWT
jgi:hypothetical protein